MLDQYRRSNQKNRNTKFCLKGCHFSTIHLYIKVNIITWTNFLLLTVTVGISLSGANVSSKKHVVCYYTNWSRYRSIEGQFKIQDIPNFCTHYIYAYATVNETNYEIESSDPYADFDLRGYNDFHFLKSIIPDIKVMISIGGQNRRSKFWFDLFENAKNRKTFISKVISYLRGYNWDGIDLDLQFKDFDKYGQLYNSDNYVQLLKELAEASVKESMESSHPKYILSVTVPAISNYYYDVPQMEEFVDWFNIITYKYHSTDDTFVSHISPLYSNDGLNINTTVNTYLKSGVNPDKLVLGTPLFGRSYTLADASKHELNSKAIGPGLATKLIGEKGILTYYEICQRIQKDGWKLEKAGPNKLGPYAHKENQWVSFDDEETIKTKALYVLDNNLKGMMFWSLDLDDFKSICGKSYPLIRTAVKTLGADPRIRL